MFEWDTRKAAVNRTKHGVSFEEAATVFGDPEALDGPDLRHSEEERRSLRLGRAATGRVLMVAYTLRRRSDGESVRIISARRASRKERTAYTASRN
ncbi:MAG TPA: BrnT family toxin [Methylomirabilota bacterium]|nr:BrnT family toxin [Methylomirabilota bacterium]